MFSAKLMDAYRDECPGILVVYTMDGHLPNHRRTNFQSRRSTTTVHKLLFADDCALNAYSEGGMQRSTDFFAACNNFGLTMNTGKTVFMHQPPPNASYNAAKINVNGTQLQVMDNFISASYPTPTIDIDRTPETPLPSSSFTASASPTAAPLPTTTSRNPDIPTNINLPTINASGVDSIHTCPHCDRTFTSHISLVGHLRIHRTDAGEPVPGAPTYTPGILLHCPQCSRTFTQRMGLFGHMHIHEGGIDRSLDTPSISYTSTMPSSTLTSSPSASTISGSSITATISETDTDTANFP
ncbi:hypothetical protein SprV_0100265100 [Sparganum proliferum]